MLRLAVSRPLAVVAMTSVLLAACGDSGGGPTTSAGSDTGGATGPGATTVGPDTGTSPAGTASTADEPTGGSGTDSVGATTTTGAPTTSPTTEGTTAGPQTTTAVDPSDTVGPGTGTTGDDTTTGAAQGHVRFVAIGDTGEGNENQYMVAAAIVARCADMGGCDFGILLGDNFYDSGVDGVDDPQWQEKFEMPYEDIDFPIYASLGNHDYGGNGIGVDFDTKKAQYQIDYTKKSQIWKLPAKYHSFTVDHVQMWDLDTNQVMTDPINGNSDPQRDWLKAGLAASQATWKIAFGHHPYISNGDHGNAGDYENLEGIPLPFVTGKNVKEFMEEAVCGAVDVYICGHDHSIQWLEPKCGTEFIVSGAGSKSEGLPGDNPSFFQASDTEGFLLVEIKDGDFTGTFYDKTGKELYSRTFSK